jgi:hypothetical protein
VRELFHDAILHLVEERNLLVAAWRDAPRMTQMRQTALGSMTLSERFPTGVGFVNLVLSGTPSFSPEVLEEAARQTRDERAATHVVAHVVLVPGFAGSATRAFLSTVILLGRPRAATKVFSDAGEASTWLATELTRTTDHRWNPIQIDDLFARLRAG